MKGINKAILVGTVGQDPVFKQVSSDFAVANFSVATTKSHKDKTSGEWVDNTEWHNVVCYNKLAEIAVKSVTKGSSIYVEGEIKTKTYDKDGAKHYRTEIIGDTISVIVKKASAGGDTGSQDNTPEEDDLPF